jgi:hypothetical protein
MNEIASLTESARQIAIARFQVLQPHLEQGVSLRQVALEGKISYEQHTGGFQSTGVPAWLGSLVRPVRISVGGACYLRG